MKTLEEIKAGYKSNTLDGRDLHRLAQFIPEAELADFGLELKEGATHSHIPLTRDAVLAQLKHDVEFGFKKALDQRGISAGLMYEVVKMWNWVLDEGMETFDSYPMYGLPLFKATAVKYGFLNPIGEDTGAESKYDS